MGMLDFIEIGPPPKKIKKRPTKEQTKEQLEELRKKAEAHQKKQLEEAYQRVRDADRDENAFQDERYLTEALMEQYREMQRQFERAEIERRQQEAQPLYPNQPSWREENTGYTVTPATTQVEPIGAETHAIDFADIPANIRLNINGETTVGYAVVNPGDHTDFTISEVSVAAEILRRAAGE